MKKICAVLLVALLVLSLTGCNNSASPSSTASTSDVSQSQSSSSASESTPSASDVVIEFWDMAWGTDQYAGVGKAICADYTAETGIQVNYQPTPWDNWYETFVTAIASNSNPDISTGSGFQAFQFTATGNIEPLDDIIEEWTTSGEIEDFIGSSVEQCLYDGHYRAIPWAIDSRVIYYNADLLEKYNVDPPTTWDEFYAACVACTSDDDYGFILTASDNMGKHTIWTLCNNNGGGIFDEEMNVVMSSDANKEAIEFLNSLYDAGTFYPGCAGMNQNDTKAAFESGVIAFTVLAANYGDVISGTVDFEVGMLSPLESSNGTFGGYSTMNNIMIYSNSDCIPETKEFLKYWSNNQLPLFTEGGAQGGLPCRYSFYEDEYYANSQFTDKFVDEWFDGCKDVLGMYIGEHETSKFWLTVLNELKNRGVGIS